MDTPSSEGATAADVGAQHRAAIKDGLALGGVHCFIDHGLSAIANELFAVLSSDASVREAAAGIHEVLCGCDTGYTACTNFGEKRYVSAARLAIGKLRGDPA